MVYISGFQASEVLCCDLQGNNTVQSSKVLTNVSEESCVSTFMAELTKIVYMNDMSIKKVSTYLQDKTLPRPVPTHNTTFQYFPTLTCYNCVSYTIFLYVWQRGVEILRWRLRCSAASPLTEDTCSVSKQTATRRTMLCSQLLTALGPSQPPIQCIRNLFPRGKPNGAWR